MATEQFYNATGMTLLNLGRAMTSGDTTIITTTSQTLTALTGLSQFRFMFQDGTDEICVCTNVSGDTWTVLRGQEGSSALSHIDGSRIVPVITAGGIGTISLGTTLNWQGNFNTGTTYGVNDAVAFGGSSWASIVTGNISNQPDISPTFWSLIAHKGDQGIQGTTGTAGSQGIQGVQGIQGPLGPGFAWRGAWSSVTAYALNDIISYGGNTYVALGTNTNHQPDTHPSDWAVFAAGSNMNWSGAWDIGTTYTVNDAVSWNGASYISLGAGNVGHQPDTNPSDWGLVAQSGSTGLTGDIIGQQLYLDDLASGVSAYRSLLNIPTEATGEIATPVSVTSSAGEVLIDAFATASGNPGTTQIPGGPWVFNIWADVDNAASASNIKVHVYKRATGGSETELFNGTTSALTTVSGSLFTITSTQPDIQIASTDILVFKFFAETASGSSRTVTMYWNGLAHYSNVKTPITVRGTAGGGGGSAWTEGTTDPPTSGGSDGDFYLVLDTTSVGQIVGGDFGGTLTVPKVIGIQGTPVSATTPTTGQTLTYDGSQWAPATPPVPGMILSRVTEPDTSALADSQFTFWLDSTPDAVVLHVTAKDSSGNLVDKTVVLS